MKTGGETRRARARARVRETATAMEIPVMDQSSELLEENDVAEVQVNDVQELWSDKNEEMFITLMEEEKKKENKKMETFSIEGWKSLLEAMERLTKETYTNQQLRNKFNGLRDRYKAYKCFLSNSGSSWDPITGQVTLTDAQWEEMYKEVKLANRFKREGCKHYDRLRDLFGDTYATGNRAHPSNRSPNVSDDEGDETPNQTYEVVGTSRHRSRSPEPPTRLTEGSFQKSISTARSEFGEDFKTTEALDKGETSVGLSLAGKDSAKIAECLRIIDDMGPIDSDTYYKPLENFHDDPLMTKIFLALNDEKGREWLDRLLF